MAEEKLLGDRIAGALEKVGIDKLAKRYEQVTGRDCGCNKRKDALNAFHERVRNMGGQVNPPIDSDAAYRQRLLEKGNGAG